MASVGNFTRNVGPPCLPQCAQHAPTGLLGAVKALKESLQRLGSDLVVLLGDMEVLLPQAATSYAASSIILEEEVEYK